MDDTGVAAGFGHLLVTWCRLLPPASVPYVLQRAIDHCMPFLLTPSPVSPSFPSSVSVVTLHSVKPCHISVSESSARPSCIHVHLKPTAMGLIGTLWSPISRRLSLSPASHLISQALLAAFPTQQAFGFSFVPCMPTMATAAAAGSKLVRIDSMQSAMPLRMTPPGRSRRISAATPLGPDVLQRRCQVVLYYSKVGHGEEAESPATVGAWMKESLSAVLLSHPVMAGRLRRDDEGRGCWEIRFNDCGVRLLQATAEVTLSEFLCSEDRDEREAKLAYWEDVNADNPNYSPLFFIQVTQFQGDGYSIGISCSLLLADPFVLARFLKSWTRTHTTMFANGQLTKPPIHLCCSHTSGHPPCHSNSNSTAISATATTTLFKVARNSCATNAAAATCFREAARKIGTKPASSYSLMISDRTVYLTVESAGFDEVAGGSATEVAWRDQLGIEEISLVEATKPVHASCRIVPCAGETLVVVMQPSDEDELMVSVTSPTDKI